MSLEMETQRDNIGRLEAHVQMLLDDTLPKFWIVAYSGAAHATESVASCPARAVMLACMCYAADGGSRGCRQWFINGDGECVAQGDSATPVIAQASCNFGSYDGDTTIVDSQSNVETNTQRYYSQAVCPVDSSPVGCSVLSSSSSSEWSAFAPANPDTGSVDHCYVDSYDGAASAQVESQAVCLPDANIVWDRESTTGDHTSVTCGDSGIMTSCSCANEGNGCVGAYMVKESEDPRTGR